MIVIDPTISVAAIVSLVFSLLGVLAGGLISTHSAKRLTRSQLLCQFYADFISSYTEFAASGTVASQFKAVGALDKLDILCSEDTRSLIIYLRTMILHGPDLPKECGEARVELQDRFPEEVNSLPRFHFTYKRKKKSSLKDSAPSTHNDTEARSTVPRP